MAQPGESLLDHIVSKKASDGEAVKELAASVAELREGFKQLAGRMVEYEISDAGGGITEEERNFIAPPEEDVNELKDAMRAMQIDLNRLNTAVASLLSAPTEEDVVIKQLLDRVKALEDLVTAAQDGDEPVENPEPEETPEGDHEPEPAADGPPTVDPTTLRVADIRTLLQENGIEVPKTVKRKQDLVDLLKKHNVIS